MMPTLLTVVAPIVVGAIAASLMQVVKRKVMKEGAISPLQSLILTFGSATACFGIVYVLLWGFTLPRVLPGMWTAMACSAAVNVFIQYFNMKAASIDKGEVSLTAPLQAMTPGLITFLAITLGEFPSRIGVAGILCMAAGSYVLLYAKAPKRWYEYLGPIGRLTLLFKLGRLDKSERSKTIVVTLALLSACFGTVGLLFDGLYTRRSVTIQGLTIAAMGLMGILLVVYAVWYLVVPDAKPTQPFSEHLRLSVLLPFLLMGALFVVYILATNPTYHRSLVAYVGTLKRLQILLTVVLGYLFFKEADFKRRLGAAALIVIGAILISMDGLPIRVATRMEGFGL